MAEEISAGEESTARAWREDAFVQWTLRGEESSVQQCWGVAGKSDCGGHKVAIMGHRWDVSVRSPVWLEGGTQVK